MEFIKPQWMDQSFIETLMKSYLKTEQVQINNYDIMAGSKPGENFASNMFKSKISYMFNGKNDEISIIMKTMPDANDNEGKVDLVSNSPLFRNEMKMYGTVLKCFRQVLKESDEYQQFWPRLIYQTNQPATVIVLEDIRINGFDTVKIPKDLETSQMIFQRLAKFHAASYFLLENGADYSDFNYSVYTMPDAIQESFFGHNLRIFKEVLMETWLDANIYEERVDFLIENYRERGQKVYSPNKTGNGYNVLNHADFIIRNMMFKTTDLENDVQFVDFQLCCLASPGLDITLALYGTTSFENRKEHRNHLILIYYDEFARILKKMASKSKLNIKIPTLLDLHQEIFKCGALAAQMSICYMPYLYDDWQMTDAEKFYDVNSNTENFKRNLYKSPAFQEFLKQELPEFLSKGFI